MDTKQRERYEAIAWNAAMMAEGQAWPTDVVKFVTETRNMLDDIEQEAKRETIQQPTDK